MALELTNANVDEVLAQEKPVLIDFWGEWCGPCRMIAPFIDELATTYEGRAVVCKCDAQENDEIACKFRISGLPTFVFVKGGAEVKRIAGVDNKTRQTLKETLEGLL